METSVNSICALEGVLKPSQYRDFGSEYGLTAVNLARTVERLDVVNFGGDFASVTLEFSRSTPQGEVRGRQSQAWVRFPFGWRIVSVHVSLLPRS